MPTYEYACKKCGEHLEVQQSFSDDALTTCPSCKGALRKVFGNIAITFKGSGFYKTDSRNTSSASSADKAADKSTDKAGDSKAGDSKGSDTAAKPADSAPAAKSEKSADTKAAKPAAKAAS